MEGADARQLLRDALAAQESGDDSTALELARRAVMVGKDDVNVQVVGARLLFNLGEHDEAQAIVTALSDHLDDAEHLGEALLFVTSQLAAARGELEAAEKGLRLGFSFEPENPEWGYVLSQVLLEQGRTKDALDAIQQARKHRPDAEPLGEAETNIRARLAAEAG